MNKTGFHPYTVVTASLLHSQGSCDAAGSAIPTEGCSHSWVWDRACDVLFIFH